MTDSNQEQSSDEESKRLLAEAQRLVAEIGQFRTLAEEQSKAAEIARKTADSEGLFAFNAKKACEEHSTTISQIKGSVEAEMASIQTNKQKSDEYLAAVTSAKATIDTDVNTVVERRKQVETISQTLATADETCSARVQGIEKAKASADEALSKVLQLKDATAQAQKGAESAREQSDACLVEAQEKVKLIENNNATGSKLLSDIQKALSDSQASEAQLKSVLDHLGKSDEIASAHEPRVSELTKECKSLLEQLESLLPGATSASLASSFSAQKQRFAGPQKRWLNTFMICIGCLVGVALPSFIVALGIPILGHSTDSPTSDIWRNLLLRMPIAIPLIWLAIYAGRNYMLSLRLEEDYAYKEAVSTAFEGYKREMSKIEIGDPSNPGPLIKLCTNILAAIAERPGRIYEGKHKDITIFNETQSAAMEVKDFASKQIASR